MKFEKNVYHWKQWYPFSFAKTLHGRHFVVGGTKSFKHLADIFFLEQPSKCCIAEFTAIFVRLLRRYSVNLVATSTARNFNNSWHIYLNFPDMINLCSNIWFIKNSKCQHFVFWKRSGQKMDDKNGWHKFHNGWSYWYEFSPILRDSFGLSKNCSFTTFPEI